MPVITALEAHRRQKERVRLFLDDEFAFDLPLMEAARLRHGQCLTAADVTALNERQAVADAFDRAVRFLSYRPRSTEEVRRYLVKKAVPEAYAELAIEQLRQHDYLDDAAFACFWIDNRDRFKPMSPRALRYELRQKGVDNAIIDAALADIDADALAYQAAQSRLNRYRGSSRQVFRHKLSGLLRRRGFGGHEINDVVLRLQSELAENDPDYFNDED